VREELLDPIDQLTFMFQRQESLYQAGARNFVFFSLPPVERSPWGMMLLWIEDNGSSNTRPGKDTSSS